MISIRHVDHSILFLKVQSTVGHLMGNEHESHLQIFCSNVSYMLVLIWKRLVTIYRVNLVNGLQNTSQEKFSMRSRVDPRGMKRL